MKIFTNPGSNLSEASVRHYGILLAPQRIVVDGTAHDTCDAIDLSQVDEWIDRSRRFPHVVGTTAAEFVALFRDEILQKEDALIITSSSKIIGTHASAEVAIETLGQGSVSQHKNILLFDSAFTDVATGLQVLLAAEMVAAGEGLERIEPTLIRARQQQYFLGYAATLDNLVKGGRAGFLRAWLANVLQLRPLVGMVDGKLTAVAKVKVKRFTLEVMIENIKQKVRPRKRVWCGIAHRADPGQVEQLLACVRETYSVEFALVRTLSPSIYLHTGPGTMFVTLLPIDDLGWVPIRMPHT